jgi:hypothetical protein
VASSPGQGATFSIWLPEADFTEAEQHAATAQPSRSVLVLGQPGPALESLRDLLRNHDFQVIDAETPEAAWGMLTAPECKITAAIMQSNTDCPGLFADIRKQGLPVKTVLQVVACNQDELDTSFLGSADLVLPAEIHGNQIPARIRAVLPVPEERVTD